jgi:hypothetical protein
MRRENLPDLPTLKVGHEKFVANSGLIVRPEYRKSGLARKLSGEYLNSPGKSFQCQDIGITPALR